MQCPHCKAVSPPKKWEEWNIEAAPIPGLFRMCLNCGGLSVHETRDILRKAYAAEFNSIRNLPEWMLLERLRGFYLKRLQAQPKPKSRK